MPKTGAERVKEYRKKVRAKGVKPVYVMLPQEAKERLSRLCEERRQTQAEVIAAALASFEASPEEPRAYVTHDVLSDEIETRLIQVEEAVSSLRGQSNDTSNETGNIRKDMEEAVSSLQEQTNNLRGEFKQISNEMSNSMSNRVDSMETSLEAVKSDVAELQAQMSNVTEGYSVEAPEEESVEAPEEEEEQEPDVDVLLQELKERLEQGTPAKDLKAEILTWMQTMKEQGTTYKGIADALNEAGIPTVSGRGTWSGGTIKKACNDWSGQAAARGQEKGMKAIREMEEARARKNK